jgi:hypothetical protein
MGKDGFTALPAGEKMYLIPFSTPFSDAFRPAPEFLLL